MLKPASRTLVLLALLSTVVSSPAHANDTTVVHGRLSVGQGLSLTDAGAIVVFLESQESIPPSKPPEPSLPTAVVRQSGARFEPQFLAIARGQRVEMPNDDVIYHNVFSYSDPNEFDLGMYPAGDSRSVRFEHSGLVRIYCSIHEGMDGLIFVAPLPLFTSPDSTGHYSIPNVPSGRYRLHVWSERLPEIVEAVGTEGGANVSVDLVLGSTSDDRRSRRAER